MEGGIALNEDKLDLILSELQGVKQDQQSMHEEFQGLKQSQQQMHHRFDVLESKVDQNQTDIVSIKESIARIERSVHEDVVTILETIEGNNQAKNAEISTLNQRLFRVESTVQKITEHDGI